MRVHLDEFRLVFLILAVLFLLALISPADVDAQEVQPQDQWVKGAVLLGRSNAGNCIAHPFVNVDEADDDPDTGEPQILGYEPGNVQTNRKGEVIWERVKQNLFAERNRPFRNTTCKAPPYEE